VGVCILSASLLGCGGRSIGDDPSAGFDRGVGGSGPPRGNGGAPSVTTGASDGVGMGEIRPLSAPLAAPENLVATPVELETLAPSELSGTAADDIWGIGFYGGRGGWYGAVSHWDGQEWTRVDVPNEFESTGIWARARNDVFVLGTHELLRFEGVSFTTQDWARGSLGALAGTAPDDLWVGPLHFTGSAAQGTSGPSLDKAQSVTRGQLWGINTRTNTVARYVNGWSTRKLVGKLQALWVNAEDDVWVVGDSIFHYAGPNSGWALIAHPAASTLQAQPTFAGVWGGGANDVWITGSDGKLRHFNGVAWSVTPLDYGPLGAVWGSSEDIWVALASSRGMFDSVSAGGLLRIRRH
jgi:hypothetical protein